MLSNSHDPLVDIITLLQIIYTIKCNFAVVNHVIAWYLNAIFDAALTLMGVNFKVKCNYTEEYCSLYYSIPNGAEAFRLAFTLENGNYKKDYYYD